jgi:hypothetical protein
MQLMSSLLWDVTHDVAWLIDWYTMFWDNAGFIFMFEKSNVKLNLHSTFWPIKIEMNVLSRNIRHHSPSDTMPYLRRVKNIMNSVGKVAFWEWDWSEWISRFKLWSFELWHHALLLVVAIILENRVSCVVTVENGGSWFFQNVAKHQQD